MYFDDRQLFKGCSAWFSESVSSEVQSLWGEYFSIRNQGWYELYKIPFSFENRNDFKSNVASSIETSFI